MKRLGVDTNVVVSFLTDRDPRQQARAAELFGAATSGEHVIVLHQAVITESVYVMCNVYAAKPTIVSAVMRDLLSLPGVVTVDEVAWPAVWMLWPSRIRDFQDACLTAMAAAEAFDLLATFDTGFAKRARRQGVATYW
ncbi:MAG: PIN domain-containing protein [Acidobacteriota bacterium]